MLMVCIDCVLMALKKSIPECICELYPLCAKDSCSNGYIDLHRLHLVWPKEGQRTWEEISLGAYVCNNRMCEH